MERLTERQENGFVVFKNRPRGVLCTTRFCSISDRCKNTQDRTCPYLKLVDRLATYEDTGLEPEEIEKIKQDIEDGCMKSIARRYRIDVARLRELARADREGRVKIFPCKV